MATSKIESEPEHKIHHDHQHKNAAIATTRFLLRHTLTYFDVPRVGIPQVMSDVVNPTFSNHRGNMTSSGLNLSSYVLSSQTATNES